MESIATDLISHFLKQVDLVLVGDALRKLSLRPVPVPKRNADEQVGSPTARSHQRRQVLDEGLVGFAPGFVDDGIEFGLRQSFIEPDGGCNRAGPGRSGQPTNGYPLPAFDFSRRRFIDFSLSRVLSSAPMVENAPVPSTLDDDWHAKIDVEFVPHPKLSSTQRETIAREFGGLVGRYGAAGAPVLSIGRDTSAGGRQTAR
jgi:hypothetical protein